MLYINYNNINIYWFVYLFKTKNFIQDKASFYLKRVSDILMSITPARVRIWVISTVTAPNKHISCTNCSSRTKSVVAAEMIVINFCFYFFTNTIFWLTFDKQIIFKKIMMSGNTNIGRQTMLIIHLFWNDFVKKCDYVVKFFC